MVGEGHYRVSLTNLQFSRKTVSPLQARIRKGRRSRLGCVRRDPLEGPEEKQRAMLSVRGEKPFVGRLEKGREEPLRLP